MDITVEMVKHNKEVYEEIKQEILNSAKETASLINSQIDDCYGRLSFVMDNLFVLRQHYFEEGVTPKDKLIDTALYLPELMIKDIAEVLEDLNCYDVLR